MIRTLIVYILLHNQVFLRRETVFNAVGHKLASGEDNS